jgi:chromatin-remodeling ATPase INO80
MDANNFRSTVLQRPGGNDDDDRERRHHRDILNPTSPALAPPPGAVGPPPGPPPRHSAFSLRSPTQTEFHHPPSYSTPAGSRHSPTRPALSSFMSSGVAVPPPTLPPPGQGPGPGHMGGGQPLSPHRNSGYYPHQQQEMHPAPPAREKQTSSGGSFYDPLTDTTTTKERRTSDTDSWHGAAQVSAPKVCKIMWFLFAIDFSFLLPCGVCCTGTLPCSPLLPRVGPSIMCE